MIVFKTPYASSLSKGSPLSTINPIAAFLAVSAKSDVSSNVPSTSKKTTRSSLLII